MWDNTALALSSLTPLWRLMPLSFPLPWHIEAINICNSNPWTKTFKYLCCNTYRSLFDEIHSEDKMHKWVIDDFNKQRNKYDWQCCDISMLCTTLITAFLIISLTSGIMVQCYLDLFHLVKSCTALLTSCCHEIRTYSSSRSRRSVIPQKNNHWEVAID